MSIPAGRSGELGGRYLDRFEKRAGRWAIAARVRVRDRAPLDETPDPEDPSTLTAIRAALPPAVLEYAGREFNRRESVLER